MRSKCFLPNQARHNGRKPGLDPTLLYRLLWALAAPLHRHRNEDEYSFVIESRIGAKLGEEVVFGNRGDLIFKPRKQWHAFWNAGDEPARILEIISPAGFERYFEELYVNAISRPSLSNQFHRIMEKAGVVTKRTNKKKKDGPGRLGRRQSPGLGFHCFRHTATSLLKVAASAMLWPAKSLDMRALPYSRIYTNIDTAILGAAIDKMPDLSSE